MAVVKRWKIPELFNEITEAAFEAGNEFMDVVALRARQNCPVDEDTFRVGRFSNASVSFTPRTGKNKGKLIQFKTSYRWLGRSPGNLRDTIRRVNRVASGNVRVYAGNYKIYWAFMIERGYHDKTGKYHPGEHFLRDALDAEKNHVLIDVENGISRVIARYMNG